MKVYGGGGIAPVFRKLGTRKKHVVILTPRSDRLLYPQYLPIADGVALDIARAAGGFVSTAKSLVCRKSYRISVLLGP